MALDPVPWFIGGGAEHSPDVARMVAYAATGGSSGVLGNLDFLVTPLPVPGTSVRVAAGAAVIPNGYLAGPDFGKQSYIARAASVTDVPIAATGSGAGRSDLVVVRIDDPQFGGQAPASVQNGPYDRFAVISNVAAGTTTLPTNLGYPAVLLARIDLPPSTGTVLASHITNLRKVAQPRRTRDLYNTQPTLTTSISSVTVADLAPQSNRNIAIPSWASQVKIVGHIAGVRAITANITGNLLGAFGSVAGIAGVAYDMDVTSRATLMVADTLTIPAALRGTTQTLRLQANRTSGTGILRTDQYTSVLWDVEFLEVASSD